MCANLIKTIQIEQKDKLNCAFLIFWLRFWVVLWLLVDYGRGFWWATVGAFGGLKSAKTCYNGVTKRCHNVTFVDLYQ